MAEVLTHAELVQRAARWLKGTGKCAVVATEKQPPRIMVIPDAIGWTRDGYSIVVECKMSRSDFLADKRKVSRQLGILLGDERWYLAPPGIIRPDDLEPGVGLLEVMGNAHRKTVKAERRVRTLAERAETIMVAHIAWHACATLMGHPIDPNILVNLFDAVESEAAQ